MPNTNEKNLRILLVDDESHILETYKSILSRKSDSRKEAAKKLSKLHNDIFGEEELETRTELNFELAYAKQGKEAVDLVKKATEENKPFAVIFLDMRMPPGQNGFTAARQIRIIDPNCNIVIVTAYTDVEVSEMAKAILPADKFFYIRKPFFPQEIQQFAIGLSSKWESEKELNAILEERLHRLTMTNIAFHEEMDQRNKITKQLEETKEALDQKADDFESISKTVDMLFKKKFEVQKKIEESVVYNITNQIIPLLDNLKKQNLDKEGVKTLTLLFENLENIASPFMSRLSIKSYRLTPSELNVAQLISQGKATKEISEILGISTRTIEFHRAQLRKKLKLHGTSKRLKQVLMDLRLPGTD